MLPNYTFALGGTNSIKEVMQWLESQPKVAEFIKKKQIKEDPAV